MCKQGRGHGVQHCGPGGGAVLVCLGSVLRRRIAFVWGHSFTIPASRRLAAQWVWFTSF